MSQYRKPPIYQSHAGTIKISGATIPKKAGAYAFHCINEGKSAEFFCIGGNANYVAMKAMGICTLLVEEDSKKKATVAYVPCHYITIVTENDKEKERDCVVWRAIIYAPDEKRS